MPSWLLVGVEQLKNMTTGPPTSPIHSKLKSTSTDDRHSPTMSWKTKISTILDLGLLSRNISGFWEKVCEVLKCTWFIPKVFGIEDSIGKCRSGLSVVGLCNGKEPWGDRQVTSAVLKGGPSQLRLLLLPTPFTCFKRELIAKKENWLNLAARFLHQSYQ